MRKKGDFFFVHNLFSEFSDIPLNLKSSDFPKALVGNHGEIGEILLRQSFLRGFNELSTEILYALGSRMPIKVALPDVWVKHMSQRGVPVSNTKTQLNICCHDLFSCK